MTLQVAASFLIAAAAAVSFLLCLITGNVFMRGPGFVFEFEREEDPQGFWFCQTCIIVVGIAAGAVGLLTLVGLVPIASRSTG